MKVINLGEESHRAALAKNADYKVADVRVERDAIVAALNTPIELSSVVKVQYDTKAAMYLGTFSGQEKTATLKLTDEVAEFLTANLRVYGSWSGRFDKGILVDVNLLQA